MKIYSPFLYVAKLSVLLALWVARFFAKLGKHVLYKGFPELIAGVHLFWIGLLIFSTVNIIFNPHFVYLHLFLISSGLIILLVLGFCPLTKLEEKLRSKARPDFTHNNSFTTTYFNKIFRTNFSRNIVNIFIIIMYAASYTIAVFILTS